MCLTAGILWSGIWDGTIMRNRPGDLRSRGRGWPILRMEAMWAEGAGTKPPLSLAVVLATCLHKPWMATDEGADIWPKVQRTGQCFHCPLRCLHLSRPSLVPFGRTPSHMISRRASSSEKHGRWYDWCCLFSCCWRLCPAVTSRKGG